MDKHGINVELVADDIWRLVLPLPFLLTQVNVWLLEENDGWTVIDTGFGDQTNEQLWEEVFREFMLDKPLKRVILTHHHIDHCALAGWLSKKWGAEVVITEAESALLRNIDEPKGIMHKGERTVFYLQHGLTEAEVNDSDIFFERVLASFSGVPGSVQYVADGDELQIGSHLWEVLELQGHSPGHLTLYCEALGLWISGDHLLPTISPCIAIQPGVLDDDPLASYLGTFTRLKQLPEKTRVLPSHGNPFVGLHKRLDELQEHHNQRLDEVLGYCCKMNSAAELARIMFPAAAAQESLWMAVGEVQAHLNLLMYQGKVSRQSDNEGIVRYVSVT